MNRTKIYWLMLSMVFVGLFSSFALPGGLQIAAAAGKPDGTISDQLTAGLTPLAILDPRGGRLTSVAFSPDSSLVAAGSESGMVYLWRTADGVLLYALEGHTQRVNDLAFSPDGVHFASASDDRSVRIWDVESGTLARRIATTLEGRALSVNYSPDDALLTVGGNFCYVLGRAPESGFLRRSFIQPGCTAKRGGSVEYWGMEFSEDGSILVTGEGQPGGSGGSIQVWDVDSYARPRLVRGDDLVVRDLALSPDSETIAVALVGSPEIWVLDVENGSTLLKLNGHKFRVNSVDYSPDGALIVSGSRDGSLRLWDARTGFLLRVLEEHDGPVNKVVFSQDGSLIASVSDNGTAIIWGLE